MENDKKNIRRVTLEVTGKEYKDGKIINTFGGISKLKTVFGGINQRNEETIAISGSTCGTNTIEADYRSKASGWGETETELEVELKGQTLDMNKSELIDAIASGSKLTKADAGRGLDTAIESIHKLLAEKDCKTGCTSVDSSYTSSVTDIK